MTYLLTFYQWVLTSTTLIKGFVDSYQSGYALPTQDQRYSAKVIPLVVVNQRNPLCCPSVTWYLISDLGRMKD